MDVVINSRQAVAHALTTVKLIRTICQPKAYYIDHAVYIHSDSFHTVCTRHHNPFSISQLTVKAASAFRDVQPYSPYPLVVLASLNWLNWLSKSWMCLQVL